MNFVVCELYLSKNKKLKHYAFLTGDGRNLRHLEKIICSKPNGISMEKCTNVEKI